ncbi:hypothetical protein DIS18_13270 [Algibacter marinivivus]|uniref:DUF4304 domain-containing protein n=2 Tax=Algibacter marinivivus TaxID=2100723 RepID=A0A2U2X1J6_9FLAO|nr:hypothetical protein DIS18_13270 [Algibacter marinivivus]
MGIFDFLKFGDNSKPSRKHISFAKSALETVGTFVEKNEFQLHSKKIETYFTTIIWRKEEQYIKITASDFPTDYPYNYDIILGEGNCDDFFESEWDSISISDIQRMSEPNKKYNGYDFPKKREFRASLEKAKTELAEYGNGFLNGNMELFYKARILTNGEKKPERIIKKDKNGKVIVELLPYNVIKKSD